jgi:putative SOS response-associated peptidase YedK
MCGRYRPTTSEEELARLYHIPIPSQVDLPISYNIAPSQKVLTIRFNPETKQRSLDALQSGLIPYWAKDPKVACRTINARAETVDKAPSFRRAFAKRRCLIPADGFYEWRKTGRPKLPFAIAMKDRGPFTFAPALEKTGEIPNLGSGCALARLSQASLMSSSRRSIPVCRCDSSSSNITPRWGSWKRWTGT